MAVTIKGKAGGVLEIMMQPSATYDEIKSTLMDKLSRHKGFFAGSDTRLVLSGRKLQHAQKLELKKILEMDYSISNVVFGDEPPPQIEQVRVSAAQPAPIVNDKRIRLVSNLYFDAKSVFVSHTLRSGQRVECAGDVTVLGDVNDGAEVIAGGSIAVLGALRGLAHAGATGRSDVVVAATYLKPKQLRISGKIAVFPPDQQGDEPRIAEYKNGSIVIRPIKPLGRQLQN